MAKSSGKGLTIAYNVLGTLYALMMFFSASGKLRLDPRVVKGIHEAVGVPLSLFPVLGALLIAGGIGLIAGIFKPKIGVAAAAGLVLYFASAIIAHLRVSDFAGLKAPIVPLLLAATVLTLRILSMKRAEA